MLGVLVRRREQQEEIIRNIPKRLSLFLDVCEECKPHIPKKIFQTLCDFMFKQTSYGDGQLCRDHCNILMDAFGHLVCCCPAEALDFLQTQMKNDAEEIRVEFLRNLKMIVGRDEPDSTRNWKRPIVESVKCLMDDHHETVRRAILCFIKELLRSQSVEGCAVWDMVAYIFKQFIMPVSQLGKDLLVDQKEREKEEHIQDLCIDALEHLNTSAEGMSKALWPKLLLFVVPAPYTPTLIPLCRCLQELATIRQDESILFLGSCKGESPEVSSPEWEQKLLQDYQRGRRGHLYQTLMLTYGKVALQAPKELLYSRMENDLVKPVLHHYQKSCQVLGVSIENKLIDPWLTEQEFSRERALQASFQALAAFQENASFPDGENFPQFGSRVAFLAPYTCDNSIRCRQWAAQCIICLMYIQAKSRVTYAEEKEMFSAYADLQGDVSSDLFKASTRMAKISEILDVFYSRLPTIKQEDLQCVLVDAVSIIAHYHLDAVLNSLLCRRLPMDSEIGELWRSLGRDSALASVILHKLAAQVTQPSNVKTTSYSGSEESDEFAEEEPLKATCAIYEVLSVLQDEEVLQEVFPDLLYALLWENRLLSPKVIQNVLPWMNSRSEKLRLTGTAFFAEVIQDPMLREREQLKSLLPTLLERAGDQHPGTRRMALKGLGNILLAAPDKVKKQKKTIVAILLGALYDAKVVLESLEVLALVLPQLKRKDVSFLFKDITLKTITYLSDENADLRKAALHLFGILADWTKLRYKRFFAEQVKKSLVPLLIHQCDPSAKVSEVNTNPELRGELLRKTLPYFQSSWEELQTRALELSGVILESMQVTDLDEATWQLLLKALEKLQQRSNQDLQEAVADLVTYVIKKWGELPERKEAPAGESGRSQEPVPYSTTQPDTTLEDLSVQSLYE
ncbi:hypothetical protein JD844_020326 [Phrynosoma platyrhinos]|uniref:Condensin complex subunit 1 n=1 Tax=Phrynosoma platyrhinos TaxID=52577 RepID=A0ABQ7SSG3_PHRPL|nr:hypothetical protein JD844_020326 [Phrynosoma platyrhinos]